MRFQPIVNAIKENNGWRSDLSPEEAARRVFMVFLEDFKLDVVTVKKKVLRVFPELEGVI
jgi:hypothetical protein